MRSKRSLRSWSRHLTPAAMTVLAGCSSPPHEPNGASGSSGATSSGGGGSSGQASTGATAESGSVSGAGSGTLSAGSGATTGISMSGSAPSGSAASGMVGTSGASTSGIGGGAGSGSLDAGAASGGPGDSSVNGDGGHVMPSVGCGMATTQALMTYVKYNTTVNVAAKWSAAWKTRDYYVWLPAGYNPSRAYPTVFLGPGCGGNGMQVVPVQTASGDKAIIVGLDPDPQAEGRPCFNTEAPDSPEIDYFDQTLKEVEAKFCVDTSRIFMGGFSSGAWLANLLGCVRSGVIRAQASAAGQPPPEPTCNTAPIAAMYVHDVGDPNNSFTANMRARDRIVALNGCSTQTTPYDPMVAPGAKDLLGKPIACVQYQGCKTGYPVVWCPTTGLGHNDQVGSGLSSLGWWHFWSSLP